MHFTFYKRLQVIAVLKFCSCSDVGQRGQPLSWWLGRKFLYGLAVGKVAWGLDKLQESEGLQKGVFFVTVFQVRVNGAGEGAGVQRACIRSKGRRRVFFWVHEENTKRRSLQSEWETERNCMCVVLESEQHTWGRTLSAKSGEKKERLKEGGGAQVD